MCEAINHIILEKMQKQGSLILGSPENRESVDIPKVIGIQI